MTEPRELFVHGLADLLYAEKKLVTTLPKLASEATDKRLRSNFQAHLEETRGQIDRLEQVFEKLGEETKAEKCPGIDGIIEEHDEFMSKESPSPEIRDLFLTAAGARTEHYEIAAYTGLVTMAKELGEKGCATLLEQNLGEEKSALRKLDRSSKRLAGAGNGAARKR